MLSRRPGLGWREIQQILAASTDRNDAKNELWQRNARGYWIHPYYALGSLNATKAMLTALRWDTDVGVQHRVTLDPLIDNAGAPGNAVLCELRPGSGCRLRFSAAASLLPTNLMALEAVKISFQSLNHPRRGALTWRLTSPGGTTVTVVHPRPMDGFNRTSPAWTFLTRHFWMERPVGNWTLEIADGRSERKGDTGVVRDVRLELVGSCGGLSGTICQQEAPSPYYTSPWFVAGIAISAAVLALGLVAVFFERRRLRRDRGDDAENPTDEDVRPPMPDIEKEEPEVKVTAMTSRSRSQVSLIEAASAATVRPISNLIKSLSHGQLHDPEWLELLDRDPPIENTQQGREALGDGDRGEEGEGMEEGGDEKGRQFAMRKTRSTESLRSQGSRAASGRQTPSRGSARNTPTMSRKAKNA